VPLSGLRALGTGFTLLGRFLTAGRFGLLGAGFGLDGGRFLTGGRFGLVGAGFGLDGGRLVTAGRFGLVGAGFGLDGGRLLGRGRGLALDCVARSITSFLVVDRGRISRPIIQWVTTSMRLCHKWATASLVIQTRGTRRTNDLPQRLFRASAIRVPSRRDSVRIVPPVGLTAARHA